MRNVVKYSDEERCKIADAYLKYGTCRSAAENIKEVKVSKTSVHTVVRKFIESNGYRSEELSKLLKNNIAVRHIRGGMATARKFK